MISPLTEKLKIAIGGLRQRFLSRVIWLTNERRNLNADVTEEYAIVAVIGREHYSERRKKYPISSRTDLARIVALEIGERRGVFARIGPFVDNAREVQFYEVSRVLLAAPPRALIWVPESVVLSVALTDSDVATVCRGDFCYYLSRRGLNQLRGGGIVSPILFRMAAGIPIYGVDHEFTDDVILASLPTLLTKLQPSDWVTFRSPELDAAVSELWAPMTTAIAALSLVYLLVISAYLSGGIALRKYQIERLGPEVTPLLDAQRKIDSLVVERTAMNRVVDSKLAAWPMWEVAAEVWAGGGAITNLSFRSGDVLIYGTAPSAIKILERVAARKDVAWARFDDGTRQAAGDERFVIRLRFVGGTPGER